MNESFTAENRNSNYDLLEAVLKQAYDQAAFGKGRERHVREETPFDEQLIVFLELLGLSFCEGQAVKKIIEASKTGSEADMLGAINYIAAAVIAKRKRRA